MPENYVSRRSRKKLIFFLLFGALLLLCAGLFLAPQLDSFFAQEEKMEKQKPPAKMKLAGPIEFSTTLSDLWYIQSSKKIKAQGAEIAQPNFRIDAWYPAVVPSTVLATLVQNNVYSDIFFGENLNHVPVDQFQTSWWFRREFIVPGGPGLTNYRLEFDGINYRANIWLNGKLVADAATAFGAFRRFSFDISKYVETSKKNVLAVEVFPPRKGEPTIGFVDWNPPAPDNNLGLWREVRIRASGDVSLDFPYVQSKLDLKAYSEARLTISVEVKNWSSEKKSVELSGVIRDARAPVSADWSSEKKPFELSGRSGNIQFTKKVELMPGDKKKIVFTPEETPELVISNPKVWWTHDLGKPELYTLSLSAKVDGKLSDTTGTRFGIREVSDYFTEDGHRGYILNGKKILIRGGGWTDDLLLDKSRKKLLAEIQYARHMNLNALRFEGFWGANKDIYNLCDENGILIMAGWSCQWEWENYLGKPVDEHYGGIISDEDMALISQSFEDQIKWLRNHPSIFVWKQASDKLPKPELEKEYIRIMKEHDPTRPTLVSTKGLVSKISGRSGVKMLGPYDYVPPVYWYIDTKNGGAYGFNTETGPGPQVPPVESLKRMMSEADLWPINKVWIFHCCRGRFQTLDLYNEAIANRLGTPKDLDDYLRKAQFINYEGMRAMFEAFIVNKGKATGIIQWMYNSAWPKLWWQLYDYYLNPNGAFYGARKACQPVNLIYNYGTNEIVAANNTYTPQILKAQVKLMAFDLKTIASKTIDVSLAPDERKPIDLIVFPEKAKGVFFLDLRFLNAKGDQIANNFYALSPKQDTLDEGKTTWYVTPVREYADLTDLEKLKPARVLAKSKFTREGPLGKVVIDFENKSDQLAFQVEIQVIKSSNGELVLPIFLDDNYIALLPGEKRRLSGWFYHDDLGGDKPALKLKGWNLQPVLK